MGSFSLTCLCGDVRLRGSESIQLEELVERNGEDRKRLKRDEEKKVNVCDNKGGGGRKGGRDLDLIGKKEDKCLCEEVR